MNLDAKSMVAKFHAPNFSGVKKVALPSDPYFDCKDKKDLEGSFPYSPTTQLLPGFISGAKERNFLASSPTFRSFLILNGPRGRLRSHEGYESHLIISVIEGRASHQTNPRCECESVRETAIPFLLFYGKSLREFIPPTKSGKRTRPQIRKFHASLTAQDGVSRLSSLAGAVFTHFQVLMRSPKTSCKLSISLRTERPFQIKLQTQDSRFCGSKEPMGIPFRR